MVYEKNNLEIFQDSTAKMLSFLIQKYLLFIENIIIRIFTTFLRIFEPILNLFRHIYLKIFSSKTVVGSPMHKSDSGTIRR